MPELPEVETTRRGILPHVRSRMVERVVVRERRLRWPVPRQLSARVGGHVVRDVERRAKYLLLRFDHGTVILHLGMSGSLRILPRGTAPETHDHVDFELADGKCLRLRDPRRFGAVLWTAGDTARHPLLRALGPEPLGAGLTTDYLYEKSRGRTVAIKNFLMDSHVVVGVGNIYANEALFRAGIHPGRAAGRVARPRYEKLVAVVREVLREAIQKGGTTLRDFLGGTGEPGYFRTRLQVYDREGEPCLACERPIRLLRLGQRATYYCPRCQR